MELADAQDLAYGRITREQIDARKPGGVVFSKVSRTAMTRLGDTEEEIEAMAANPRWPPGAPPTILVEDKNPHDRPRTTETRVSDESTG